MTEEKEMSSEEVKEQDLAQEALDATALAEENATTDEASPAGEPAKKEPTVPLHEHTALRTRAQTAELEAATLRGKVAGLQEASATQIPTAKSPLDAEIERQTAEGIAEEDMAISPRIMKAQEVHNQQVANQRAVTIAEQQLRATQSISANKAKAKYDDWQNIVLSADGLLTKGELVDIDGAGVDFGEVAYAKAKVALERNKSEANPESKTETAPEKKKGKSEAEAKAKAEAEAKAKEKVPTQQEILSDLNVDATTEAAAKL